MYEETDHLGNLGADRQIGVAHKRSVVFSNKSIAVLQGDPREPDIFWIGITK